MSFAGLSLYSVEAAAIGKDKQKSKKKATKAARAGLVFTHRGFSGPAVLDLSHHAVMAAERRTEKPGSTAFAASTCSLLTFMLMLMLLLLAADSFRPCIQTPVV